MSLVDTSLDCAAVHTRIKRKLDDFDFDDDLVSDLVCVRMKKDEPNAVNSTTSANQSPPPQHNQFHNSTQQQFLPRPDPSSSSSSASSSSSTSAQSVNFPLSFSNRVQFFVRLLSESNTVVLIGNPEDSVKSIHEKIYAITGIPVADQRLIYRGKQLQWEQSLSECSIQNDAGLQLVGRMRSTNHPHAWKVIDEMVSLICRLCKDESLARDRDKSKYVKARLQTFLHDIPQEDSLAEEHLRVFMSSCAPSALVMLYMSPHKGNRECADESIRHFVNYIRTMVRKTLHGHCLLIVLEFCKLLKRAPCDDALYSLCRSCLGSMVENVANGGDGSKKVSSMSRLKGFIMVQDICKFIAELASRLEVSLDSSMESVTSLGPSLSDVCDFTAFLQPVMSTIGKQVASAGSISMPSCGGQYNVSCCGQEVKFLYGIFVPLLEKMERCLDKLEAALTVKDKREGGWDQYLALLKELNSISKLYPGAEELFWTKLRSKKVSLCYLILRFAKRVDDHKWILEHKDVTNFESRRHLLMMLLPEVKDEYEEIHEMLIDRSQLLAESFEYIARAETDTLRGGLFMEFKNEEATGPGVLREWFFLVCQAIFNPQNALFVACPNDRRRFFPNPASKVDPLHLEYFNFSGRVIALALMHKVQVGIVFDRVFFLQLAGTKVSLEDIQDADPYLYSSCKQILDMDADMVDQDALGLTFVREVEELGSRKVVELCDDGRSIVVNSKNREVYVDLLIQDRFVTSIAEQVSYFAKGFEEIVGSSTTQNLFFNSLEHEDLDWMLHGSETAISVEDWMSHTEYNGYKETDPQIGWFWKIVGGMTAEQRKVLLFFWTSVKYLPVEGFSGLASRLYIYKSTESYDRLPSSHTCFYRLVFPPYPSMAVMQDRLKVITQEHVGCSFGTW